MDPETPPDVIIWKTTRIEVFGKGRHVVTVLDGDGIHEITIDKGKITKALQIAPTVKSKNRRSSKNKS